MKIERSHLRTCLAAAVAPSDAEPVRECSLSVTGMFGKKLGFPALDRKPPKSQKPHPLSLMKALELERELFG